MKKLLYIFAIVLFATSCGTETADLESQLEQLKQENTELKMQSGTTISSKDAEIAEYASFLIDIQNNLDKIRDKEGVILNPNKEGISNPITIKEDLQILGNLLADNKKKISRMKAKLANSNGQLNDLEKVVMNLTKQAESREMKILGMKNEMSDMGVAFDELYAAYEKSMEVISDKNETIETQEDLINTAYYAFGSKKELKKNNVISSEGGIIGIGTTKKLKDDFNKEYFTKINIQETTEIPLGVKKVYLITTHPSGSYEFVENERVEKIKILDATKFWSVSKYLVIRTK